MSQYASNTTVGVSASKNEIERTLERYGATSFQHGWNQDEAAIAFTIANRQVQIRMVLPRKDEERFTHHSRGPRTPDAAFKEWEQACRQKWRALALIIKAKLEAVESGISTVEKEFLADIRMPDGSRFWDHAQPEIERVYLSGNMPMLALPAGPKE